MDDTEQDDLQLYESELRTRKAIEDKYQQSDRRTSWRDKTGKPRKMIEKVCVECGQKFKMPADHHMGFVFCAKCGDKKCERCGIVLSRKNKCKECHVAHGKPSDEQPDKYCATCIYYV